MSQASVRALSALRGRADEVYAEPADPAELAASRGEPDATANRSPASSGGGVSGGRDQFKELRRELRLAQRRAVVTTVAVMIVVSIGAWLVAFASLSHRIDGSLRAPAVVDRVRSMEDGVIRSATRINVLAEDADGKFTALQGQLAERSATLDRIIHDAMDTLEDNAAAARKGFQLQLARYHWQTGQPPVKMIHVREGVCFQYFTSGSLGPQEAVAVDIGEDGYWYIRGQAKQPVTIGVLAMKIIPLAPEAGEESAETEKAALE